MIVIRQAIPADQDQIWNIIRQVIANRDSYVFNPDSPRQKMLDWWCGADKHTYVAEIDGKIAGTFFIKDNQPDLGSHIANAAYMVSPEAAGRGLGKAMGEFSVSEARQLGYRAMQFNFVVSSNQRALRLWENLGFKIIGEIPEAFNHKELGLTNAYIMYKKL